MGELRFIPDHGSLVDVTVRTFQARYLLCPSKKVNERIVGVLHRARQLYSVKIIAIQAMSNHYHLLLWVPDAEAMADFMAYVNSNVAREVGLLVRWSGRFWHRRYSAIVVSDEEAAQVGRFKYVLAQGVKEGIVARPEDWPGVNSIQTLTTGKPLVGSWIDRTAAYRDRLRDPKNHDPEAFESRVELDLDKLPCWDELSNEAYRAEVACLVEEIVREGAEMRRLEGIVLRSAKSIRRSISRLDPYSAPREPARRPAPRFHAATRRVRESLLSAYREFVAAFRYAAADLRMGNRHACFPVGSFPPGLPFVRAPDGG